MFATAARVVSAVLVCFGAQVLLAQPGPSLQDDDGQPVAVATPAVRVVTLAPSLTELVFAAGAGDRLVGVSAYSDYPVQARGLPQVANAAGISWESLLALKPDLVLAWKGGTRPPDIARLHTLGIKVFVVEIKRFADVPRAFHALGRLTGNPVPSERAAESFRQQLANLEAANKGKPLVRTFFEISTTPLMTINRDHVIGEMIALCGGANIFGDLPGLVSEPTREELLARNPSVILYGKTAGETRAQPEISYAGLRAAQEGKIYGITADYAFRPGPRLLLALEETCIALDRSRASSRQHPLP